MEAVTLGVTRNLLINLREVNKLQTHDYMIIEDEDYKGKIIDVGCGPGTTSLVSLLAKPDRDITFMDGSRINLEFVMTLARNAGINPNDLKMLLGLVGSKTPETYDTVVMSHVLEHVDNVKAAIEWLMSITNKGGTIFIAVPYKDYHWSPNHLHFFRVTDDKNVNGIANPKHHTFDIQALLHEMHINASIEVYDASVKDKRQPFDSRGQLDMVIKIKRGEK